jgi:WD40 repeat protein
VIALRFSADGKLLASGSNDRTARIWDWATRSVRQTLAHPDVVGGVAFSPDAQHLATLTRGGEVRIWDLSKASTEGAVVGSVGNPGNGLAWSHDGSQIIATGGKNTFRVWDVKSGAAQDFNTNRPLARTCAISPADDLAAFGLENGHLDIVDLRQRTRLTTFPHWSKLRSVAFSPDGKTVAGSTYDGSIHIWDVQSVRAK